MTARQRTRRMLISGPDDITADDQLIGTIRRLISYSPDTGLFTWLVDRCSFAKAGDKAGSTLDTGYVSITVAGVRFKGHQLAYFMMTGVRLRKGQCVDHIDLCRSNNAWLNLRVCTQAQNCQNTTKRKINTSGFMGVSRNGKRWRASIKLDGKYEHIGNFKTPEEASKAYLARKSVAHPYSNPANAISDPVTQ